MELFIPSVLVLLLAVAVIFFVLPRFGAASLAIISVILLVLGIYQHMNAFGTEYRLSTWQLGLMSYAPYIMLGGVLLVIAFYLLSISPLGGANTTVPNMPEMPTVNEMPSANSATNVVTAGVNNALKGITNIASNTAAAVGLGNAAKAANANANKGMLAPVANVANAAKNAVANAAAGVGNAVKNLTGAITGNNTPKNNKGFKVPGLNFPISQL